MQDGTVAWSAGIAYAIEGAANADSTSCESKRSGRIGGFLRWRPERSGASAHARLRHRSRAERGEPERQVVRADAAVAVVVRASIGLAAAEVGEPRGQVVRAEAVRTVQVERRDCGRLDERPVLEIGRASCREECRSRWS